MKYTFTIAKFSPNKNNDSADIYLTIHIHIKFYKQSDWHKKK